MNSTVHATSTSLSLTRRKISKGQVLLNIVFIVICIGYVLPMLLILSISFTDESAINSLGFSLIPNDFSVDAYKLVFKNPIRIIDAYKVTVGFSILSTLLAIFVMTLYAYPLSRQKYKFRRFFTFYAFFTMLFSGGMVPSYLINTRYLNLANTIWIYILPGLVSAWNIIIIRTFFQGLPESLPEAAKIDGASELRIYFQIMLPLSIPVMAAIGFMFLVGKWNDWNTSLIYITDPKLYSLQYLLQRILREAAFIKELVKQGDAMAEQMTPPAESLKYAMAVVAAGPILIIFPFFQKYFVTGLTIGSVKG